MKLNLVLEPPVFSDESDDEPVTLAEAKGWLKITVSDDDILIENILIPAARRRCEHYLNISLIERTVTASLQNELGNIELPYGPVDEIEELADSNGTAIPITDTTLGGQKFKWLRGSSGVEGTPRNNFYSPFHPYVTVTYSAGYPDGIPEEFKLGVLNEIAWLYENRGGETPRELGNVTIVTLKPYRRVT